MVITSEILRPQMATYVSQNVPGARAAIIIEGRGHSIVTAARDAQRASPRRISGSQMVAAIFSEDLARQGIIQILDEWSREPELRPTVMVLVCQGKARDLITRAQGETEDTLAAQFAKIGPISRLTSGFVFSSTVHDMIMGTTSDSKVAITGVLELAPFELPPVPRSPVPGEMGVKETLQPVQAQMLRFSGLAIFKEGHLVSIVPVSHASRGIALGLGKVTLTTVEVECPKCQGPPGSTDNPLFVVKVTKAVSKVGIETKPELLGTIRVNVDMDLSSQGCTDPVDSEMIDALEEAVARALESEILEAVNLARTLSCDIFGFADSLHRRDPKLWSQLKDRWDHVIKSMGVRIDVRAHINRIGLNHDPVCRDGT